MHLGAHSYLFTEHWSDAALGVLDTAAELGLSCFEISVGDDVSFSPALTRGRAEALGLELLISPGGEWPLRCDLSADAADDRTAGLAWHMRQVDVAQALGAVAYCGALYGHPGVVQRRVPPADEYPRTAEGLHRLAEYGAQRGVAIVLEPMSHFRTHLVNTPEQAMRLIGLAHHANLHVLLDTYHLITEVRDYRRAVVATAGRLWGLHACENDRGAPGGGLVPWDQVAAGLRELGWTGGNAGGYVLLETYNSSQGDFAWRRGMFHNVCPDPVAFVRQGVAFLRQLLGSDRATPAPHRRSAEQ